jgi:hypothetical protein
MAMCARRVPRADPTSKANVVVLALMAVVLVAGQRSRAQMRRRRGD